MVIYVGPQIGTRLVLELEPILAPVLELESRGSRFRTGHPKIQSVHNVYNSTNSLVAK